MEKRELNQSPYKKIKQLDRLLDKIYANYLKNKWEIINQLAEGSFEEFSVF